MLTPATEDYLKTVYKLEDANEVVATNAIAERMDVSAASVTNMMKKLSEMGLVEYARYQGITLTDASGGLAEENDFMLSTSATSVLGFSITGTFVPAGSEGILLQVSFSDYTGEGICFGTDPVNNVISNVFGNMLDTNWGNCYEGTLAGDVNYDGTLDILDLVALANLILGQEYLSSGDMNQDGQLDILDIVSLINVILSP